MLKEGIPVQIIAGTLDLSATASRLLSIERSEHLEMWVGERPRPPAESSAAGGPPADRFLPARPEVAADGGLGALLEQAAKAKRELVATDGGGEDALDPQLAKVLLLLEKLFGMKGIRQTALRLPTQDGGVAAAPGAVAPEAGQAQAPSGWGMIYESHQRSVDTQSASLTAQASLTLADGSRLAFDFTWSQSSVRIEESSTRLALGDARLSDPLVLDLDGDGLSFSAQLATIDLDRDGTAERVARPGAGDALLVWDRNGDGLVEDGSELIGATTGQAFVELAALDRNGNGWIDEADLAYGQLRLWDGGSGLRTLAAGGVGAIATTSVALPYQHRGEAGDLQAVGRRAGVFIREDGTPGAALQVDLVT
jgi:hypothetical protein